MANIHKKFRKFVGKKGSVKINIHCVEVDRVKVEGKRTSTPIFQYCIGVTRTTKRKTRKLEYWRDTEPIMYPAGEYERTDLKTRALLDAVVLKEKAEKSGLETRVDIITPTFAYADVKSEKAMSMYRDNAKKLSGLEEERWQDEVKRYRSDVLGITDDDSIF